MANNEEDNRVVILMIDEDDWSIYNEAGHCLESDFECYEDAKECSDEMGWEEVDTFNL